MCIRDRRDGVNIRATANGSSILTRVKKGTVLPYYTEKIKAGSYTSVSYTHLDVYKRQP